MTRIAKILVLLIVFYLPAWSVALLLPLGLAIPYALTVTIIVTAAAVRAG